MDSLKDFIKENMKANDSTLDVSDSSPLTDLLINPGAAMLDPVIAQLQLVLNNMGMRFPDEILEEELDAIAANFLMDRDEGSKSEGLVELFYDEPTNLTISAGASFSTPTGETYITEQDFFVSSVEMNANTWNFPLYSSGPIPVIATATGLRYAIDPNKITATDVTPAPTLVTNPTGFSDSTDAETNAEFAARILESIVSRSFASANSIKSTLQEFFPTIQSISVTGMGDDTMLRDIAYSGLYAYDNRTVIDFYGKVSGLHDEPYPRSQAFYKLFFDDPSTSGIIPDLPTLDVITHEFDNAEYAGVFRLNDALSANIAKSEILKEGFSTESISDRWHKTDAAMGIDTLRNPSEITVDTTTFRLKLGNRSDTVSIEAMTMSITPQFIYFVLNSLKQVNQMGAVHNAAIQKEVESFTDLENIWS